MFSIFSSNRWAPDNEGRKRVQKVLDEVIAFASEDHNFYFLKKAREYYSIKAGQTFEDDFDFINRMNTFLEWFIFDFQPEGGLPGIVFERYLDIKRHQTSGPETALKSAVTSHVHSVFLVKELRNGVIKAKDLVNRKTHYITSDDTLEKGDIIESRIIRLGKKSFFSYTYCLHPKSALKSIREEIWKKGRANIRPKFFLSLAAMQLKWRHSRKINVNRIYDFR